MQEKKENSRKSPARARHIAPMNKTANKNTRKTNNVKDTKKIWIISSITAVALCFLLAFVCGAFTSTHTYGDISFDSNGIWTVMSKSSDDMLGMAQSDIEIQSGSFRANIESLVLPNESITTYSHGFADRILGGNLSGAQDVITKEADGVKYVGGWHKTGGGDSIEAYYAILDLNNDKLVTFSLYGPKSQQDKIVDIFKTVKYNGVLISAIQ